MYCEPELSELHTWLWCWAGPSSQPRTSGGWATSGPGSVAAPSCRRDPRRLAGPCLGCRSTCKTTRMCEKVSSRNTGRPWMHPSWTRMETVLCFKRARSLLLL